MTDGAPLIEMGGFTEVSPPMPPIGEQLPLAALMARLGGGPMRTCLIPGEPPSKQRPRGRIQTRRDGTPYIQAYTPAETRKAEQRIAWQLKPLGRHPQGPLALVAIFYRSSAHRVDLDNLQKALLDAATMARTWTDDSQVKAIACLLRVDRAHPRIVCALSPIPQPQLEIPA